MPDQDEHEIVLGPRIMRNRRERLRKLRPRSLAPGQGVDMRAAAGGFEQFIQVLGVGGKPLLVVRFAAKSGDRNVVDARLCGESGHQQPQQG